MNRILATSALLALLATACDDKATPTDETSPAETTATTATTETPETTAADEVDIAEVEVKPIEFDDAKLKGGLPAGEVVGGFGFVDERGDNYVAFSKEEIEKKGGPNTLVLNVRHVVKDGDAYQEVRAYREAIAECDADVILEPKFGRWSVTDLNEDGIGEATFAYTADCTSDVSPCRHLVIVTEGGEEYVLRGRTKVKPGPDDETWGGDFEADEMPEAFLAYAEEIWAETSLSWGLKADD